MQNLLEKIVCINRNIAMFIFVSNFKEVVRLQIMQLTSTEIYTQISLRNDAIMNTEVRSSTST